MVVVYDFHSGDGLWLAEGEGQTFEQPWLLPTAPAEDAGLGIDMASFVRDYLGFTAEPAQLDLLLSTAKRGIVNCSRQYGKSLLGAAKAVHRCWTRPESLVLVVSPTLRQSGLVLGKARRLLAATPAWRRQVRKDPDHALSLRFPNGSLMVGLPAKEANIRGFSATSMVIIDEASRVPEDVYRAVRPMLAVGNGDLWLLSTPLGRTGFFHEVFMHGGEAWTRFEVPATACPERITPEFLAEELAEMGAAFVKQEYFCQFIDARGTLFDRQLVEDAVREDVRPLPFGA